MAFSGQFASTAVEDVVRSSEPTVALRASVRPKRATRGTPGGQFTTLEVANSVSHGEKASRRPPCAPVEGIGDVGCEALSSLWVPSYRSARWPRRRVRRVPGVVQPDYVRLHRARARGRRPRPVTAG